MVKCSSEMEWVTPQFLLQVLSQVFVCGALWGAIRADIRNIHKELERLDKKYSEHNDRIVGAHTRIDRCLERRQHARN